MEYYFSKTLNVSFDEALRLTTVVLKLEGFGVITEINMHEKLKEKLNVDSKRYIILGACNPHFAYKALQVVDKIEIATVNPIASMQAITNHALGNITLQVTNKLKKVIDFL